MKAFNCEMQGKPVQKSCKRPAISFEPTFPCSEGMNPRGCHLDHGSRGTCFNWQVFLFEELWILNMQKNVLPWFCNATWSIWWGYIENAFLPKQQSQGLSASKVRSLGVTAIRAFLQVFVSFRWADPFHFVLNVTKPKSTGNQILSSPRNNNKWITEVGPRQWRKFGLSEYVGLYVLADVPW